MTNIDREEFDSEAYEVEALKEEIQALRDDIQKLATQRRKLAKRRRILLERRAARRLVCSVPFEHRNGVVNGALLDE